MFLLRNDLFRPGAAPPRPVPARAVQLPPAAAAAPSPPPSPAARARRTPPPTRRPSPRTPGFAPRHVRQLHRPRQQATILKEYNDVTCRPMSVDWMRDAQSSGQGSRLRDPVRRVRRHRGRMRRKGSAGARRDRRRRLCRRRCHRDCSGRRRCRRGHSGRRCVTSPAVVVVLSSWSPALQSARPSSALALKQQQQRVCAAEGRLGDGRSRPRAASFVFRQGRNGSSASWVASYDRLELLLFVRDQIVKFRSPLPRRFQFRVACCGIGRGVRGWRRRGTCRGHRRV